MAERDREQKRSEGRTDKRKEKSEGRRDKSEKKRRANAAMAKKMAGQQEKEKKKEKKGGKRKRAAKKSQGEMAVEGLLYNSNAPNSDKTYNSGYRSWQAYALEHQIDPMGKRRRVEKTLTQWVASTALL